MSLHHFSSYENRLLLLLRKEHSYYRAILDIEQQEHIGLGGEALPLGQFRALQRKKKILIHCIQEVEVELEPLKTVWKKRHSHKGLITREIEAELGVLDRLLREILHLDNKNRRLMKHKICLAKKEYKN